MVARALLQIGDNAGRQFLLPYLDSKDVGDRDFAAVSFALGGDNSDIHIIAKLLHHGDAGFRSAACAAMERVTGINIHAPKKLKRPSNFEDALLWMEWYKKEYGEKP